MPTNYKVLGQSNPAATTATTLYTVPSGVQTVISTVNVSNLAATNATFRIAVRPNGETLAGKHYVAYDVALPASSSIPWTIGITVDEGDVITVYASNANVAFSAFGSEIS